MKSMFMLLVLLTGCSTTNPWKTVAPYPEHNGLSRYDNKEVTCYTFMVDDIPTMQCKFKKDQ